MNRYALSSAAIALALGAIPACSSTPSQGTGGAGTTTTTAQATTTTGAGGATTATTTTGAGGSGGVGGTPVTEPDPDFGKAFPQDHVARLDLTVTKERWQQMLDEMTALGGPFGGSGGVGGSGGMGGSGGAPAPGGKPSYVECDVSSEGVVLKHAGVRFKGNDELYGPWSQGIGKLPFHITFDEFEDTYPETKNQRYYGFKGLSLFNGASDPSLLRDKIGTDVFGEAGLPVPATAFYRVFVDHGDGPQYFGVYTGIELPSDTAFLETAFGTHKYDLYQPEGVGATWATYDEDSLGKENNKGDYASAQALFVALHADQTNLAAWEAGLEAHLDVDGFLHWLAINTVTQDRDTYGLAAHNYYLYAGKYGRFSWIPWSHGQAFSSEGCLSLGLTEVTDQWPLIRFLLDDPSYKAVYDGYVAQTAAHEYEVTKASNRFQAAHDLIKPYVIGAEGEKPGYTFVASEASFDAATAALIAHAQQRKLEVAAYVGP